MHWAVPAQGQYVEAWKALIELQKRGLVRSIGVSNFPRPQLEEIIEATSVVPVIHQIELHPYFQQRDLRELHAEHGILTQGWGPLGQGKSDLLRTTWSPRSPQRTTRPRRRPCWHGTSPTAS